MGGLGIDVGVGVEISDDGVVREIGSRYDISFDKSVKCGVYAVFGGNMSWDVGRGAGDGVNRDVCGKVGSGGERGVEYKVGSEVDY